MHLLVLSLALSICWVTKLAAQDQKFVPGQALAKFVAGSTGDAAVTRAAQAVPPDLGALATVVNDLESGVGLPLLATQVSSGNWFIVSLDLDRLAERTVRQLRDRDNVTAASASAREGDIAGGAPAPLRFAVNFAKDSPEHKALLEANAIGSDEPLVAVLSALRNDLDLPLERVAAGAGELVLQVDLEATTLRLVERLQALPEIEAAQPNYILGAIG
ncbi:MAG: hypothetical protein JSU87_15365 [Gemmatimonadota bacterium]|nr:MAG: hypothetical protein JSU87_15365 [Gemmatimonadota bacterium]